MHPYRTEIVFTLQQNGCQIINTTGISLSMCSDYRSDYSRFFFNVFVYKVTKTTKHCADCTGITVSALFLLPSFNLKT